MTKALTFENFGKEESNPSITSSMGWRTGLYSSVYSSLSTVVSLYTLLPSLSLSSLSWLVSRLSSLSILLCPRLKATQKPPKPHHSEYFMICMYTHTHVHTHTNTRTHNELYSSNNSAAGAMAAYNPTSAAAHRATLGISQGIPQPPAAPTSGSSIKGPLPEEN